VAVFELRHAIVLPPIYPAVAHHLPGWLYLHLSNLALFPLLGLQNASGLAPESRAAAESLIDAYWGSGVLFGIAAAGSIAWVIAMLSAAVALTRRERRRLALFAAIIAFVIGGWAETNLFLPSRGYVPLSWWLLTLSMAAVMFFVSRPALAPTLLVLAGSFFGAAHIPPTGPLGAACFLAAAVLVELPRGKSFEKPARPSAA
jgi:hypothetical protein